MFAVAFGVYLAVRGRWAAAKWARCDVGRMVGGDAVVFSYMGGMVHPYYTVALAPAIAGLVGIGAVWAWRIEGRAGTAAARWPR